MYTNLDELIEKYKSITSNNSHLSNEIQEIIQRGITFQYDENETDADLLFLGMNPSFGGDKIDGIFPWTKEFSKDISYFKPFFTIEERLKEVYQIDLKWTHFDLFVFRETKQARIEKIFMNNEQGRIFLAQQLEVLKERLLRTKPKVIVASNALIRTFLGLNRHHDKNGNEVGIWLGDWIETKFDPKIGTHVILQPEELKGTKIFFTSMLSGQRALDLGTRERLVWHIAEVLK